GEHLHDRTGAKTVFATHYHELTQLSDELVAVRNFNVAVREVGEQVLFLHRLQPGGADRSYGIEVGRLAGLPDAVIGRAREVLALLEGEQLVEGLQRETGDGRRETGGASRAARATPVAPAAPQLSLFAAEPHPALTRLKGLDANQMTPLEALRVLDELARLAREG